jgi:hypothetical protein
MGRRRDYRPGGKKFIADGAESPETLRSAGKSSNNAIFGVPMSGWIFAFLNVYDATLFLMAAWLTCSFIKSGNFGAVCLSVIVLSLIVRANYADINTQRAMKQNERLFNMIREDRGRDYELWEKIRVSIVTAREDLRSE